MVSVDMILWAVVAFVFVVLVILVIGALKFNIPVVIMRFTGNKQRPLLIMRKAKKMMVGGVPKLIIRGYKDPIRDYMSENYYPTVKGKYGGLILWEFEDGLLTPVIPQLHELSKDQREKVKDAMEMLKTLSPVEFSYDDKLYHQLRLKAVDDVDVEFMIQQNLRLDSQYTGGWKDFLNKYGGHITIIIIAMLLLAGLVVWLDKMPEFAAQCYGAAETAVRNSLVERAIDAVAPAG